MMLRIAKPLNFVPVSPSVQQRAKYGIQVFCFFVYLLHENIFLLLSKPTIDSFCP